MKLERGGFGMGRVGGGTVRPGSLGLDWAVSGERRMPEDCGFELGAVRCVSYGLGFCHDHKCRWWWCSEVLVVDGNGT
jgi:hypothetical protein